MILGTCHHWLIHHGINVNRYARGVVKSVLFLFYMQSGEEALHYLHDKKWICFFYCQFNHQ